MPRLANPYTFSTNGRTRHHIIPQQRLADIAKDILRLPPNIKTAIIMQVLMAITLTINFGFKDKPALRDAIMAGDGTAEENWEAILSWLPGNLVVGERTTLDPGNNTDVEMLQKTTDIRKQAIAQITILINIAAPIDAQPLCILATGEPVVLPINR